MTNTNTATSQLIKHRGSTTTDRGLPRQLRHFRVRSSSRWRQHLQRAGHHQPPAHRGPVPDHVLQRNIKRLIQPRLDRVNAQK